MEDIVLKEIFINNNKDYCKEYAKINNCYKIILDCDDNIKVFYEKSGLTHKTNGMVLYF